jgi:hypothetical protein
MLSGFLASSQKAIGEILPLSGQAKMFTQPLWNRAGLLNAFVLSFDNYFTAAEARFFSNTRSIESAGAPCNRAAATGTIKKGLIFVLAGSAYSWSMTPTTGWVSP